MIYQSDRMTYESVRKVFRGKVNDVEICESTEDGRSTYYTVLVIRDHETVKKLIRVMEASQTENNHLVELFDTPQGFLAVFDYVKERPLDDFYMARELELSTCEEISLNLIVRCMTSGLPWPILDLILKQHQVQLTRDNSIALSFAIDLEGLDETCTEADCVLQCSLIVRDLLEKKSTRKNTGYRLLSKKIPRQSYESFRELYKDIRLASTSGARRGLFARIRAFFHRNGSAFFRALIILCLILIVLVVITIISKAIWGDVPFLRLFVNPFERIGTESLID